MGKKTASWPLEDSKEGNLMDESFQQMTVRKWQTWTLSFIFHLITQETQHESENKPQNTAMKI